ncbi:MAG: CCA tRNA nucleotidyltransferase [Rhizobiaceae bacterium]
MNVEATIEGAAFLQSKSVQNLLALLNNDGEEARIAGGAVRNALIGQKVVDVDVATTALPAEVMRRAGEAGYRCVPTGIDHGTVTVIIEGEPFEVTTLRADSGHDGRRAQVSFGRDWTVDAERRDFSINGLYAAADGTVIDLVGGLNDIETRTVRFIGDAAARIEEDYLRVLRFFRFFAWYGHGRPDAEAIRAIVRLKDGIKGLSAERVWSELKKLLSAPDPSRALLWMRQSGVLTDVLPESGKWGIDLIHALVRSEKEQGWPVDALLRLEAIVPPYDTRMKELAERLRLSKVEAARLLAWAQSGEAKTERTDKVLALELYRGEPQGLIDKIKLALATATEKQDAKAIGALLRQLAFAETWQKPVFPLSGIDMLTGGMDAGPEVGRRLKQLEEKWVASGFELTKAQLLDS